MDKNHGFPPHLMALTTISAFLFIALAGAYLVAIPAIAYRVYRIPTECPSVQ